MQTRGKVVIEHIDELVNGGHIVVLTTYGSLAFAFGSNIPNAHHVHIVSEDYIIYGDYYYDMFEKKVKKCTSAIEQVLINSYISSKGNRYCKVILSNNSKLGVYDITIPFIIEFIKHYNKHKECNVIIYEDNDKLTVKIIE